MTFYIYYIKVYNLAECLGACIYSTGVQKQHLEKKKKKNYVYSSLPQSVYFNCSCMPPSTYSNKQVSPILK